MHLAGKSFGNSGDFCHVNPLRFFYRCGFFDGKIAEKSISGSASSNIVPYGAFSIKEILARVILPPNGVYPKC